ncbi:unnamed protein product [Cyprideis torosa]|uniref:Uncharacterized protein n=1 Tax=Cyprideis torosa TaxID=163714 RepID=A0A7R8WD09_9CRUS|nr:unnamed protein product [Cyprideis torosa]CAG0888070.1 unnamed protein product [Cyprideis torosa]
MATLTQNNSVAVVRPMERTNCLSMSTSLVDVPRGGEDSGDEEGSVASSEASQCSIKRCPSRGVHEDTLGLLDPVAKLASREPQLGSLSCLMPPESPVHFPLNQDHSVSTDVLCLRSGPSSLDSAVDHATKCRSLPRRGKNGDRSSIKRSNSTAAASAAQVSPSYHFSRRSVSPQAKSAPIQPRMTKSAERRQELANAKREQTLMSTSLVSTTPVSSRSHSGITAANLTIFATLPRKPKNKVTTSSKSSPGSDSTSPPSSTSAKKTSPLRREQSFTSSSSHHVDARGRAVIGKPVHRPPSNLDKRPAPLGSSKPSTPQSLSPSSPRALSASSDSGGSHKPYNIMSTSLTLPRNLGRKGSNDSANGSSKQVTVKSRPQRPNLRTGALPNGGLKSKRDKPVIYLEGGNQTMLSGLDIERAMQVIANVRTCSCKENADVRRDAYAGVGDGAKPDILTNTIEIIREKSGQGPDEDNRSGTGRQDVASQAEINTFDPNRTYTVADTHNVVEQLKRLSREHAELQHVHQELVSGRKENEEIRKLKETVEEEQKKRGEVEKELTETAGKVKTMLSSLESVEREFVARGDAMRVLERQLSTAQERNVVLNKEAEATQLHVASLRRDLEKSLAAQKALIQQVQETEAEARELQEFLQVEKTTLQEALRDAESELSRTRGDSSEKEKLLKEQTARYNRLLQLTENCKRHDEQPQETTKSYKENGSASQPVDLSSSTSALSELSTRLQHLTKEVTDAYQIDPGRLKEPPSPPLSNGHAPGSPRTGRSLLSSLLSALSSGPRKEKKADDASVADLALVQQIQEVDGQVTTFLKAIRLAQVENETAMKELASENEQLFNKCTGESQLLEQLQHEVNVLRRELCMRENEAEKRRESQTNGLGETGPQSLPPIREITRESTNLCALKSEISRLKLQLQERDLELSSARERHCRHKQILMENWRRAEAEVCRLDEALDNIVQTLHEYPDVLSTHPKLEKIVMEQGGLMFPTAPSMPSSDPLMSSNEFPNGRRRGGSQFSSSLSFPPPPPPLTEEAEENGADA